MIKNASAESFPQSRSLNIATQEIGDEILIYDLEKNRAFCLNQTSALVWQHSTGRNSVASIALNLSEFLRQPVSEEIIWLALEQLNKEQLLLAESVAFLSSGKISRRKLLREAALTSAVALPLISAIAAPVPAEAQSCIPFGSFGCRTTADCCPPPQGVSQVLCDNGSPATFRCLEFPSTR